MKLGAISRWSLAAVALLIIALVLVFWSARPSNQCLNVERDLRLCVLSEMAKLNFEQSPPEEHTDFAISGGTSIKLHAARNEVVAFQWLLSGEGREGLSLHIGDFSLASAGASQQPLVRQFIAHYHHVDRGAYSWGPDSEVLPWPAHYPDALVPQRHSCTGQSLYQSIPEQSARRARTLLWQDIYVPKHLEPGGYRADAVLKRGASTLLTIPIELQVWPVILPDENSLDAIGELYRTYRLEGVGESGDTEAWRQVSNCYQQVAHAHRSVFLERNPVYPTTEEQWLAYTQHYDGMLSGSLFSERAGYQGPGSGKPVSVWRTPWPQPYDMKLSGPLSYSELREYEQMAKRWRGVVEQQQWQSSRWFAYVFDEVDGPEHTDPSYLSMVHQQMALVQQAIDSGSGSSNIDLLWTSHSNPAKWADHPALDLRDKVRLWAPNAHAADPEFLAEQSSQGKRAWFYHSGHPAVGAHAINASGIEMRTWGVIAARYQLGGVLMWAVNLGNDEKPFADPNYKPE
ncbi:MAG: glycoside hydrolase domain-containing protein, partial [Granulosicoccaceae bacterium]